MPSSGSLKMPTFGLDMLLVLCNAEKIFWYSERLISEFIQRGFTVEVREFANEMVATAEVWGLQLPYLIGKRYQVEALNMEGQSKSCHEEAQALSEALQLDSKFIRDINPLAKAEAIVLEAVKKSSSAMSQSEEPEGIEKPPEETEFKSSAVDVESPTAAVMKDKKNKYVLKIPKLSKLDPDTSKGMFPFYSRLGSSKVSRPPRSGTRIFVFSLSSDSSPLPDARIPSPDPVNPDLNGSSLSSKNENNKKSSYHA